MLKDLFRCKIPQDIVQEKKAYPYQRILEQLESLSQADVDLLEKYIQNLKHRRPTITKNQNQRTKGKQLKTKHQISKRKRKLDDEIHEAKQKLLTDRIAANERSNI
ncbi:hypothetical protein [Streptococcus suis]